MSILKTIYLQHLNGASPNATLDANGNMTVTGTVVSSSPTGGMRNKIINGDMVIDQRYSGTSATAGDGTYIVDRWSTITNQASNFTYTVQQNAGSVTPPAGLTNYLGATVTASNSSISSGTTIGLRHKIEGYNIADLAWGTSSAKPVTLSFWVRSSLTGTFGGALWNSSQALSYPFSYSISQANTWTYITLNIAGPTTSTWVVNNGTGVGIDFSLGTGTTRLGTAGSWASGFYQGAIGQTQVVSTNGATFYLTGVQLEAGTIATPFERRLYGQELALCQRYYWRNNASSTWTYARQPCIIVMGSTTGGSMVIINPVTMRGLPVSVDFNALALYDGANLVAISNLTLDQSSLQTACMSITTTGATQFRQYIIMGNGSASSYLGVSAEL
jgi:hypothetical protein